MDDSGKRDHLSKFLNVRMARIGSAFGVKLENYVPSSSFGQTKMGCRLIAGPISKIKREAHLSEIQTLKKE